MEQLLMAAPLIETIPDAVSDVAGIAEDVAGLQEEFEPVILTLDEWLSRVLDLFSATLSLIMGVDALAFFAVFGLFLTAFGLAFYLIRTGKTLSR